jgi:hypothetical protein
MILRARLSRGRLCQWWHWEWQGTVVRNRPAREVQIRRASLLVPPQREEDAAIDKTSAKKSELGSGSVTGT